MTIGGLLSVASSSTGASSSPAAQVQAITDNFWMSIDSGSDADTFPKEWSHLGKYLGECQDSLNDIQNGSINLYGVYTFDFQVELIDGSSFVFKDYPLVASDVSKFVLSVGTLEDMEQYLRGLWISACRTRWQSYPRCQV